MNPINPQQFQAHGKVHGTQLAADIAAERARRRLRASAESPVAIRRAPVRAARVRAVAFGALTFLAGGLVSRTGAADAQVTPPPPPVAQVTEPTQECATVTDVDHTTVVTRTLPRRDRLAQIPV
jgi:hypothetical protein